MSPINKAKSMGLMAVLIISGVLGVIISTSEKTPSIAPSQASGPLPTSSITPTSPPDTTILPTLLRASGNQDVPLTVLGSKEVPPPSYLYTELTSKGVMGNLSDRTTSFYWLTEAPQQTVLRYGTDPQRLSRQLSGLTPVHIHEATFSGLLPNTVYFYTGHAPVVDSFTTPSTITYAALTRKISGTLKGGDGQCLVRGVFSREDTTSAYAISLSNTTTWQLSIGTLRTADLTSYFFPKSTDTLELDALCVGNNKVLYSGTKHGTFAEFMGESVTILLHRDN